MNKRWTFMLYGIAVLFLGGCRVPTELDIPITIPPQESPTMAIIEPTPIPPDKTLIVCIQQEPDSLYIYNEDYLYGGTGREANTILPALYDGPIELLETSIEPVILQDLPSFSSGTARFEPVEVGDFEVYLNPDSLQPENLRPGYPYLPSGCHSPDCVRDYEGGLVTMDRMVVEVNLREDITWSDGVGLTASDSVFSYNVDRSGSTPTTKYLVDRTHSYNAIDDWTVRWIGIPGFSDLEFQSIFWHPLPRHIYGDLGAEAMQENGDLNFAPVGWGPYMLETWVEGDRIEMVRNPFYFRQETEMPYFDQLVFRFLGSDPRAAVQQLLTMECDVLDETLLPHEIWSTLVEYQEEGHLQLLHGPAGELVRLDFNTDPVGRSGEAFFQTTQFRQAVAACVDRERLAQISMEGLGRVAPSFHSYLGLQGQDGSTLMYAPDRGSELLRQIGWVDEDDDPETPLVGWDVKGVYNGERLELTLLTPDDEQSNLIANEIKTMLFDCGIHVEVETASTEDLTSGYPDGIVFGRKFDMVLWSWPDWWLPLCEMFSTREIPSDISPFGVNATGFSDPVFDLSCDRLLLGDHESIEVNIRTVQTIFNEQLPALPIIQPPRLMAVANDLCGFGVDAITPSLLWNIEMTARGEGCN
jgi:peptide/nickel transport system substrate-binding protein